MKLTNVTAYSIFAGVPLPALEDIEKAMTAHAFEPCSPSQEKSIGFVPPREPGGAFVESIGGQWIARVQFEARSVPGSEVRRALEARVKTIEEATGRKPGRKERKELKEDIALELMPRAFSKMSMINVWIDPASKSLVLDTTSAKKADDVATVLVRAIENMSLEMPGTTIEPGAAMASWLYEGEPPAGFTIDRDCELKASDTSRASVRYENHPLDTDEVKEHIKAGMRPTRLAMTYDDRISFVLTSGGAIRSIVYLEGTGDAAGGKAADNFDADVVLSTGEVKALRAAVTEALGGVAQFNIGQGADQTEAEVE